MWCVQLGVRESEGRRGPEHTHRHITVSVLHLYSTLLGLLIVICPVDGFQCVKWTGCLFNFHPLLSSDLRPSGPDLEETLTGKGDENERKRTANVSLRHKQCCCSFADADGRSSGLFFF